nr:type II secretion system protein [Pseudomonas reactans]
MQRISATGKADRVRRHSRGFTLLELMVVIAVIAIVLGLVGLVSGSNPARQAREEAGQVLQLIQQVREQAVIEGREYGVRVQRNEYQLWRLEPQGWRQAGAVHRLAQGVHLQLELEGQRLAFDSLAPQLLLLSSDEVSAFTLSFLFEELVRARLVSDGVGELVVEA